jgi:hypothetical protein
MYMKDCFKNKMDVVEFVSDQLKSLKVASALTMTIHRVKSEDYYVTSVIDVSSDDTVVHSSLKLPMNI